MKLPNNIINKSLIYTLCLTRKWDLNKDKLNKWDFNKDLLTMNSEAYTFNTFFNKLLKY